MVTKFKYETPIVKCACYKYPSGASEMAQWVKIAWHTSLMT